MPYFKNSLLILIMLFAYCYSESILNNIKTLGEVNCGYFSVASSFINELIFETSYEGNDELSNQRFFYGYDEQGRPLFIDQYQKKRTHLKTLYYGEKYNQRHFSEIAFLNLTNENADYQNIKVISIGTFLEIYDYYNGFDGKISACNSFELFGNKIFSERNSLFELKKEFKKYIFAFNSENYFFITKFFYNSANATFGFNKENSNNKTIFGTNIISCYDAESYILCFYRNLDRYYELSLYNPDNLKQISNSHILNNEKKVDSYTLFFKAIYLQNNIGVFVYYLSITDFNPFLEINKLKITGQTYTITPFLRNNTNKLKLDNSNKYKLDNNYNKNDIIKINEKRFSLISITKDNELLVIIFDFYNTNNLLIKYYKMNTLNSNNLVVVDNIRGYSILNSLGMGFTGLDKNTNEIFTKMINFGFSEVEDLEIILNFLPICRCLYFEFQNFTSNTIDNNIFGYKILGIKILSIPNDDKIKFFYNDTSEMNKTNILENQILSIDQIIRLEVLGNSTKKQLYYSVLYKEVEEYSEISNYTDKIEYYGDEPNNFYNPIFYEGKAKLLQFTLSLESFRNAEKCGKKLESSESYSTQEINNVIKDVYKYNTSISCFMEKNGTQTIINYGGGGSGGGVGGGVGDGGTSSTPKPTCHGNCFKCSANGNNENNNCIICASGMGYKEDEKKENEMNGTKGFNCYKPPIDFYYFNDSVPLDFKFIKCFETCKNCSINGSEYNHSCLSCKEGYYEKEEDLLFNLRNCYKFPQPGYALDKTLNILVKCDISCINCSEPSDISSNYCTSCNTTLGYYPLEDNKEMCLKKVNSGYFLGKDEYGNKTWLKCADGCGTCSKAYDSINDEMNCLTCKNNSNTQFFFKDNSSNCYNKPPEHYYLKENNGIFKYYECSDNCLNCEGVSNNCTSCKKDWEFNEKENFCYCKCPGEGQFFDFERMKCSSECSNKYYYKDPDKKHCINCKDSNYYLLIKNDSQKCISSSEIKEGYYVYDQNKNSDEYKFNVVKPCYSTCLKCKLPSTDPQNQKCISCRENYYLVDGTDNCEKECNSDSTINNYYVKDKEERKCINCQKNKDGNIYKFINENKCISKEDLDGRTNNYRFIDKTRGILEDCYKDCLQCSGNSNDTSIMKCTACKKNYYFREGTTNCYEEAPAGTFFNSNTKLFQNCKSSCSKCENRADYCTECKSGFVLIGNICKKYCGNNTFLFNDTCVDSCGNYYYKNTTSRECVNCKDQKKYIDIDDLSKGCINKNDNYYEDKSNLEYQKFGVIEKCYERCKTCIGISNNTNEQKCSSCIDTYYLRYETNNCMSTCDDNHDNYFVKEGNKCINCKKESNKMKNNKKFKYIGDNTMCLDETTAKQKYGNFYYIDEATGTIESCHPNCLTCLSKSSDYDNMLCLSCDNSKGYYMFENTSNCYNYAPQYYFFDKLNKRFSQCYSTCRTCNEKGDENNHKCLECKDGLYNYKEGEKCLANCNNTDYPQNFITNDNFRVCLSFKCNYKDSYRNLVQLHFSSLENKCVIDCNSNEYYFGELPICIESCSSIGNYKNFIEENYFDSKSFYDEYYTFNDEIFYSNFNGECYPYCKNNINDDKRIICTENFGQFIYNSLNYNLNDLLKIIKTNKIIVIQDYNLVIPNIYQLYHFNSSNINNNNVFVNSENDISDINLEDCLSNFNGTNIKSNQSLIFYKNDQISNQYLTNNVYYKLLIDNGTTLNLEQICQNKRNIIYSPISQDFYKEIDIIKKVNQSQSINLFNPKEKIFNDFCEPFFYDNMDINMNLRIKYFYYKDNHICQENCYFNGIKFSNNKAECVCPYNYILMEEYNNKKIIESNKILNNQNLNAHNNIRLLKCSKMFYKYPSNFGFFVFLIFLIASLLSIIFFYLKEYNPFKIRNELKKLYELKKNIKEERVLIEEERPKNEKKEKKEKKSKFKLIIGFLKRDNNNQELNNKHKIRNKKKLDDDGIKTIKYEKDMFSIKPIKNESIEQLIKEPKYNIIRTEISMYKLKVNNNNDGAVHFQKNIMNFLKIFLNNYPMTKICFMKKEYKLMSPRLWFEHFSLNLLYYLSLFSILTIVNCIIFNDDLITEIYENPSHKLPFIKYFINSCYAGVIYIILGIIFSLIFIYGIQGFHLEDSYDTKIYKSEIKGKISSYLIGIIIFQVISNLFIIFGWYYSSIFCNIYNNSQKYLVIQILFGLIFEAIFYLLLSLVIFLLKK